MGGGLLGAPPLDRGPVSARPTGRARCRVAPGATRGARSAPRSQLGPGTPPERDSPPVQARACQHSRPERRPADLTAGGLLGASGAAPPRRTTPRPGAYSSIPAPASDPSSRQGTRRATRARNAAPMTRRAAARRMPPGGGRNQWTAALRAADATCAARVAHGVPRTPGAARRPRGGHDRAQRGVSPLRDRLQGALDPPTTSPAGRSRERPRRPSRFAGRGGRGRSGRRRPHRGTRAHRG